MYVINIASFNLNRLPGETMKKERPADLSRRDIIKHALAGMAGFTTMSILPPGCSRAQTVPESANPPNILLMVADDAGWRDVGYHGSEIRTPNLDRLMREGVEMDQFYVCPTCSPTRAAILTGRYASRYGILGPIAMRSKQTLPPETLTLPRLLQQNGYSTAITGKWHLGLRPENGPRQYGFDHTYGYLHGQIDQFTHVYKNGDRSWHRNDQFIEEEGHATDLIRDEATRFITTLRDKSKPFFLYVPFSVPHYPLQEEEKWVNPYESIENESRRLYAASVTHMDAAVGSLVETLETEGLRENTLVIFISDNGGQEDWEPTFEYEGRHGTYDRLGDNRPLRDWKGSLYEGGIRVPAIINWPSRLKPARNSQVANAVDIYPTVADVAGLEVPEETEIDGISLLESCVGKSGPDSRMLYWKTSRQSALRKDDWKLVVTQSDSGESVTELYNLSSDPYEKDDLSETEPEMVSALLRELGAQSALDSS